MDWYVVIKTIKGRCYYYRQKTWREGARVRTHSEYIGLVANGYPDRVQSAEDRPSRQAPTKLTAESVATAAQVLTGKKADDWEHHWDARRHGETLVRRDKRIDATLKKLNIGWTHGTNGAYFSPQTGKVNIPPLRCFVDKRGQSATSAYYIVVFHEVVHWTMLHTKREVDSSWLADYAREELVAELGAVLLMRHFDMDIGNEARHALYFQTWLDRAGYGPTRDQALEYAKVEAERAVRFILECGIIAK